MTDVNRSAALGCLARSATRVAVAWLFVSMFQRGLPLLSAEQKTRQMGWDPRQPISSRLRPDDELIILTSTLDVVQPSHRLSWQEVEADAARRANFVV